LIKKKGYIEELKLKYQQKLDKEKERIFKELTYEICEKERERRTREFEEEKKLAKGKVELEFQQRESKAKMEYYKSFRYHQIDQIEKHKMLTEKTLREKKGEVEKKFEKD